MLRPLEKTGLGRERMWEKRECQPTSYCWLYFLLVSLIKGDFMFLYIKTNIDCNLFILIILVIIKSLLIETAVIKY